MMELDKNFWENRYKTGETGWDMGEVSPPLKAYFDQLEDKNIKILIPGAGNAYEVEYLHKQGFQNVYLLDFAEDAIENFKARVPDFPQEHLIIDDFFKHQGIYDLITEQTFFCAIDPGLRENYMKHVWELLRPSGKLAGLFFNAPLNNDKPPFGGNKAEYEQLFKEKFDLLKLETAYNSIAPRAGQELFFIFQK